MGLGAIVLDRAVKLYFHVEEIAFGCVTAWLALVGWRSTYRTWLGAKRKPAGFFQRRVLIIVGTDRRAMDLAELFTTHPEAGVQVVGLVGSAREARAAGRSRPVAGELRRCRPGPRRRRRRRRRAVLERHRPGAARRADPRRAAQRTVTSTSIRACRASTSGACRRCRSPTSRCSTSQSPSLSRVQVAFKRAFDVAVVARAPARAVAGPRRHRRRRQARPTTARCCSASAASVATASSSRSSSSGRCASTPRPAWRRCAPSTTSAADRCSSWTRDPRVTADRAVHPRVRASTSCPSCSTCCAAR